VRQLVDARQQLRHLVEHDERGRARERISGVRVRVDVLDAELPHVCELAPDEQRRRQRQAAAERLADAEHVCDLGAWPQFADPAETREDRVDDEQRTGGVAAVAQYREEVVGRHPRAAAALNRLDDHDARIRRKPSGIPTVRAPMHRARQPRRERLPETLQPGGGEREQPGPVISAVERDDPGLAGREQCGAQRDLDCVLAGDAELCRPRQRVAETLRHLRLRQVAERVHHRRVGDGPTDHLVAVAERRDAEAAGQVDVLPSVLVPDAAAFGPRPDH
jgi:hypothetical protein